MLKTKLKILKICVFNMLKRKKRIQELKQLNHSIAYSNTILHFSWNIDTITSYKRDQRYTIEDMLSLFGGMMGCAIGMSVASACELIYWIILKPVTKLLISKNVAISVKWKPYYTASLYVTFFIW